jgi:hypothetical protein
MAAEQVGAGLADPGDAVLPGQHARPLQRFQRLGDRASRALRLGGDRLIRREAAPVPAVVKPHSSASSTPSKARVIGPRCWPGCKTRLPDGVARPADWPAYVP